ncbi:zinc finger protein [Holotrichia oblita]|uniref:Zinc finger protein n=1 Tax=Holotrichia oblita TaxID=644536 RepID=A0ACB9SLL3_HOLOL|nr:zinc finger protein [Holotrichia oblita]
MSNRVNIKLSKTICPICKEIFEWKHELLRHFKMMHTIKRAIHKCKVCNKSFRKATSLDIHRRLHVTDVSRDKLKNRETKVKKQKISELYKNVVAEILYSSDSDCEYELLQTVIKVSSIRKGTHLCEFCDRKFINSNNLERHIAIKHSNVDDAEMISNQENMQIDDKEVSENMLVDKDVAEDNMQIDDLNVDNMDSENQELNTTKIDPLSSKHDINDKYRCSLCNSSFRQLSYLYSHKKWHLKQLAVPLHNQPVSDSSFKRKYSCQMCRRSYSQKIYLENHMRLHENGKIYEMYEDPTEEKYLCTYCGKQFVSSSQFSVHIKLHVDGKKYLCSFCGKLVMIINVTGMLSELQFLQEKRLL